MFGQGERGGSAGRSPPDAVSGRQLGALKARKDFGATEIHVVTKIHVVTRGLWPFAVWPLALGLWPTAFGP